MDWIWDQDKNLENQRKHRVSFETALLVFNDPERAEREDDYQYEERWQTIGTAEEVLIVVIHTLQTEDGRPGTDYQCPPSSPIREKEV